jgi:hypothetical protein
MLGVAGIESLGMADGVDSGAAENSWLFAVPGVASAMNVGRMRHRYCPCIASAA